MGKAKDIVLRPIDAKTARTFMRKAHYSGKVVNNSQIHIGVFYHGVLEGALQFGPSLDKRKMITLVDGTLWNEFIELNRLAFTDVLPRNSESRALGIAMKILRRNVSQLKWVVSFADATQCGDGTIYRASGFVLTGIKENDQIWIAPTGTRFSRTSLTDNRSKNEQRKAQTLCRGNATKGKHVFHTASIRPGIGAISSAASPGGASSMKVYKEAGFEPLEGYQLRYIYFLDKSYRERLTVPEISYRRIWEMGAGMYRGEKYDQQRADVV